MKKARLLCFLMLFSGHTVFAGDSSLWAGGEFPSMEDVACVDGVEHVAIHRAVKGKYQFLHGAAIINHKGVFYVSWANSPVDESSADECVRGRRSHDGGTTWSSVEMVAPPLVGKEAHSHGIYFSNGNELWFFAAHFCSPATQTDAYLLDETSNAWKLKGLAASAFHPFDEPRHFIPLTNLGK